MTRSLAPISGIYEIVNTINGKRYIGQSSDVQNRFSIWTSDLRRDKSCNQHLQNAWNKYGEKAFVFHLLFECSISRLSVCEQATYDLFEACGVECYNEGPFLDSPIRGKHHSEATRAKMSASAKVSMSSMEARARVSKRMKSYYSNPQARVKLSAIAKLRMASPEARALLRRKQTGRKASNEARVKMSISHKGKCIPSEQRVKISRSMKGKRNSLGRVLSPEHRAALLEGGKATRYCVGHKP
jgi:group I intron endonuclease